MDFVSNPSTSPDFNASEQLGPLPETPDPNILWLTATYLGPLTAGRPQTSIQAPTEGEPPINPLAMPDHPVERVIFSLSGPIAAALEEFDSDPVNRQCLFYRSRDVSYPLMGRHLGTNRQDAVNRTSVARQILGGRASFDFVTRGILLKRVPLYVPSERSRRRPPRLYAERQLVSLSLRALGLTNSEAAPAMSVGLQTINSHHHQISIKNRHQPNGNAIVQAFRNEQFAIGKNTETA